MRRQRLGTIVGVAGLVAAAWWGWTAAEDAGWFDAKAVPVADDVARAMLRDVKRWDAATSGERRGVAEQVAARLDAERAGFTLRRVRPFGFEGHLHEIAVFRHATTGLEFSLVPGGAFTMGSPEGEAGRGDDETQHEVTLTRAFLLARTECTQAAWERVTGANPSKFPGSDLPVEMVSRDDAGAFLAQSGLRLPTEAEWEYACRAGTTTAYWSGDAEADLARVGWVAGNLDTKPPWLRWALTQIGRPQRGPQTQPVGALPANPFGLHDVHGNVWELCGDWYGSYGAGPVHDPGGPPVAEIRGLRIIRGGSFDDVAPMPRSAHRGAYPARSWTWIVGFRLARSVPGE